MSISKRLLFVSSIVFIFAFFTLSLSHSSAQTTPTKTLDLTVSPVFYDFQAKPGSVLSNTLRIRNNTTSTIQIKAEVKKMGGDENGDLTIKDADDDTSSWIDIKTKSFTTKPLEWTNIPFSITVPKSAAYGYYWALSFTTDENNNTQDFTGAKVNASVVVPILLNVSKEGAKTDGKLLDFTKDNSWYEYLPVKFLTTVENTGNVHFKPKGNIFIKDFTGKQIAILDMNPGNATILPGLKKVFETSWDDSFIAWQPKFDETGKAILDKNGKQKRELKIRFDKVLDLRIGKYTASELVVISGEKRDITLERSISFFVFPWKIVIGSIVFLIFALLGFANTAKSIIKRIKGWFSRGKK